MSTTTYIKPKHHRNLDGNNILIKKVHNYYRTGGIEQPQTGGGVKWVGKTFVNIPKRIEDDAVVQGDERLAYIKWDEMELREAVWDKDLKKRVFYKTKEKMDRDFYKVYKKVYDVEVIVQSPFKNKVWNWETKVEEEVEFEEGTTATLSSFPVSRLKVLLETLELDEGVELVDGKDKAGNPAKVKPFDWEDGVKFKLEGKFVGMRVRGEGMDTKYTFKEGKEFEYTSTEEVATPKAPKETAETKMKAKLSSYVPLEEEIDLADVPFL